ncbi:MULTISPECIES: sensor histidine kinase [unclassified Mesorhizobium]|uniref:sensor histidine kinase n=1 Tax=unclassified Mesorhizobium TaxID=325217 RepID=UPI001125F233|nr:MULTISPECIES: sensor histidine kinase [unclassified Mesorhizobium]MBZ9811787.1 sensor histidine kinase [Mesorhizobium sp. ESP-6-2]TPM24685.1 sensor histidine kinase [Mesorhizobium sp. B2-2-2]
MSDVEHNGLGTLDWVLILAPYRKDASYTASLLQERGIRAQAANTADLGKLLTESPGVLVVTHEALNPEAIATIARFLQGQPNWSEIPIIVLLDRRAGQSGIQAALSAAWPRSRQIFYQRPVAALELISGIQSALLTRARQRDVRDYLERETELRHELNHRVKNILATVVSIFDMTRRGAISADGLAEDFKGRLRALSNVHSAVFAAGGETVPLMDVANSILAPYRSEGQSSIIVEGPELLLSREAGTTLALSLHELATNAIKYGGLSQPEGRIRLEWKIASNSQPTLILRWTESGGPPVIEPSRVGYGTRYMRAALTNLFGEPPDLVFAPEGLRFSVRGLLSRLSSEPTE